MIIRGMGHAGFDKNFFSGISARKGSLSTAIEGGVPEHILLWMQSGHVQDVAARRYVQLNSLALLYSTYESFGLWRTGSLLAGIWPMSSSESRDTPFSFSPDLRL